MQPEDFLLSVKDDLEYVRDTASGKMDARRTICSGPNGGYKPTTDAQKLATIPAGHG